MAYHRKILYLDYYENGERVSGGGFVKLEARQGELRLDMTVRGLHTTDSFVRDVLLQAGEKEVTLGQIALQGGFGRFSCIRRLDGESGELLFAGQEMQELKIPIGGAREIRCGLAENRSRSAAAPMSAKGEDPLESRRGAAQLTAAESASIPWESGSGVWKVLKSLDEAEAGQAGQDALKQEETKEPGEGESPETGEAFWERTEPLAGKTLEESERPGEGERPEENESLKGNERLKENERSKESGRLKEGEKPGESERPVETTKPKGNPVLEEWPGRKESETGEAQGQAAGKNRQPVKLREDKWQQLSAIYPHVHPFEDEREYLSIRPADFVLFPARYYQAVNNSFLLHGYYNYEHLILARMEQRGEVQYYLGVPGNYYEREKQVALMFGFESFESASEPAKTGDFGYYMMRTQL